MTSHKEIEDQAAEWLARRDSDAWAESDAERFRAWLDAATANRVALLRLEAAWEQTRRLKALGAGLPVGAVPPPGMWRNPHFFEPDDGLSSVANRAEQRRRGLQGTRLLRYGVAASLALAMAAASYFYFAPRGDNYSTPIGEVASVRLRDGSDITLNTASTVRVDLTPKERRIDLEQGEGFFVVAKDSARPFVVLAGNKRVIAVGTQFSVRRDGGELRVIVTEGTVSLDSVGHELQVKTGRALDGSGYATLQVARLPAGTIAQATGENVLFEEQSMAAAEDALTWRMGYLTFHETTLADAVEELNRYNTHRIVIEDPKVAGIRISGTFRPANYEAFVRLLRKGFSIKATDKGKETTLAAN